jgi:hypothetical protein
VIEAINLFHKNNGVLPEQIVIYRDGVGGPTIQEKVEREECKIIHDLLETTTQGYMPKIIYCLVDRNI